jgi:hypothetical protein
LCAGGYSQFFEFTARTNLFFFAQLSWLTTPPTITLTSQPKNFLDKTDQHYALQGSTPS